MNFKIENSYLDITNYPTIEKHFEEMASKGWLIKKILVGNIFIYKKIKPEVLDFSISPYEVETEFTRKTKSDLAEFKTVCESVGWNFATKSFDLHIYFKARGTEALDIQTDEEEEFRILETLAKRNIKSYYILIPNFILLLLFQFRNLFIGITELKTGLTEIAASIMLITVISLTINLIHMKSFIKVNRKNLELGSLCCD